MMMETTLNISGAPINRKPDSKVFVSSVRSNPERLDISNRDNLSSLLFYQILIQSHPMAYQSAVSLCNDKHYKTC